MSTTIPTLLQATYGTTEIDISNAIKTLEPDYTITLNNTQSPFASYTFKNIFCIGSANQYNVSGLNIEHNSSSYTINNIYVQISKDVLYLYFDSSISSVTTYYKIEYQINPTIICLSIRKKENVTSTYNVIVDISSSSSDYAYMNRDKFIKIYYTACALRLYALFDEYETGTPMSFSTVSAYSVVSLNSILNTSFVSGTSVQSIIINNLINEYMNINLNTVGVSSLTSSNNISYTPSSTYTFISNSTTIFDNNQKKVLYDYISNSTTMRHLLSFADTTTETSTISGSNQNIRICILYLITGKLKQSSTSPAQAISQVIKLEI